MTNFLEMDKEISKMQERIDNYVDQFGIEKSIEKLVENLRLDKSSSTRTKLKYLLGNTEIGKLVSHRGEKHEILCCIYKILISIDVPRENIYSNSSILSYDPAKNGSNIIKHDVSFLDVISYLNNEGILITYTRTKEGEERDVYFLRVNDRNLVAVCSMINEARGVLIRFITARYFRDNKEEVESVIRNVIRDENLDIDVLDQLRERANELLCEYRYF